MKVEGYHQLYILLFYPVFFKPPPPPQKKIRPCKSFRTVMGAKPCYICRQALISSLIEYNGEQEKSALIERARVRFLWWRLSKTTLTLLWCVLQSGTSFHVSVCEKNVLPWRRDSKTFVSFTCVSFQNGQPYRCSMPHIPVIPRDAVRFFTKFLVISR